MRGEHTQNLWETLKIVAGDPRIPWLPSRSRPLALSTRWAQPHRAVPLWGGKSARARARACVVCVRQAGPGHAPPRGSAAQRLPTGIPGAVDAWWGVAAGGRREHRGGREAGRQEGRGPERPPGSGGGGPAAFGFASFPSEARGRPGRGLSADPPHGRSPPRGREHAGRRSEPLCSRSRGCRPRVGHRPSARPRCSSRSGAASSHPPGARRPGRGREAALPRRGERDGTGRARQRESKTVRWVTERCVPWGFTNGGLPWEKGTAVVHPQPRWGT